MEAAPKDEEGALASPRRMLSGDHQRIERLLLDLLAVVESNDREDIARLWGEVDDGLRRHMIAEERHVLPLLEAADAKEAHDLRDEHDELRTELTDLGMAVDLHVLRLENVKRFVDRIRAHAHRENALAYALAERQLPPPARAAIAYEIGAGKR